MSKREIVEPPLPDWPEIVRRRWYVAQVVSGREQVVAELLRGRGHTAIVPVVERYRARNRYAKSKVKVTYALMPRYLIVGFEPDAMQPWRDLFGNSWVQGVVMDEAGPMPVYRKQLARFLGELGGPTWAAPDWERYMRSRHEFKPGDYVDVAEGSLAGWRVQVDAIVGEAAKIIVNLLGRDTVMSLPLAHLQKAE